ncbi:hypothetical protein [Mycobacterium sp. 3519A]|uniref:hypothetical protein n=1 Tax=Mycobacterium sp. 3519A TaxID=2057184 RepID=UPI00115786C1|nr:hypothetical protein [Mycobacterium sp. 3519A]
MRLRVTSDPTLPLMAWCAHLCFGNDAVDLLCGSSVEIRGDGFFEGAWAGSAEAFDFSETADVFGSGGRIAGDELIVVTPSHTLERVQFIQHDGEIFVSNSLVFLLTAAGAELDPHHTIYAADFTKIVYDGTDAFDTVIPVRFTGAVGETATGSRGEGHIVYFKNLRLRCDGRISFEDKPQSPPFDTFDQYVAILADVVQKTVTNAASACRKSAYSPLASVSTGYDSPAVAALARRAGCERAVTFRDARPHGRAQIEGDSGEPVAAALQFGLKEFEREAYRGMDSCPEAEFLATGMSGEDVNMLAFEHDLQHSVFFTGYHGGRVWNVHSHPDEQLRSNDMSGASLNEFRLRVDFVHVPAPFICARRLPKLLEIANSATMRPWSIGTDYDRPIARRIVEEAGVPRAAFGQKKRATTALLHVHGEDAWTSPTRQAVRDFSRQQRLPLRIRLSYLLDAWTESGRSLTYRILHRLNLLRVAPALKKKPIEIHSHSRLGPLPMIWATERIRPRYSTAVEAWRNGQ